MRIFSKSKKAEGSVSTAITVLISVVLGGLILVGIMKLIDNNVSPAMAKTFEEQQINVSREVPEENAYSLGDINKDGVIDNKDLDYLGKYLIEEPGYNCDLDVADINGDGKISLKDETLLRNMINNSSASGYKKGDINKDGTVDKQDITYFERYLAGWTGYSCPDTSVGDMNGDGAVNETDYDLLVTQID